MHFTRKRLVSIGALALGFASMLWGAGVFSSAAAESGDAAYRLVPMEEMELIYGTECATCTGEDCTANYGGAQTCPTTGSCTGSGDITLGRLKCVGLDGGCVEKTPCLTRFACGLVGPKCEKTGSGSGMGMGCDQEGN